MEWKLDDEGNHRLIKNDAVLIVRKKYGQAIVVIWFPNGKEQKFAHPDDDVTNEQLQEFAIKKFEEFCKKTFWTESERAAVERLKKISDAHRQTANDNPYRDLFSGLFGGRP